jgi:Na+/melibiose symporter-like transporter
MTPLRRIAFMSGQIGLMSLLRFYFTWNLKYASDPARSSLPAPLLEPGLVGLALLLGRIFDGITDPVAGSLSDRWVQKGRPRQQLLWIAFALPPLALALLFAPEHSWLPSLRWSAIIAGMFLFFVGYTFYAIPYWSLVADYSDGDERLRDGLSVLLGAGLLLATAIAALASPALIQRWGYLQAAAIFAALAGPLMVLPIFASPKKRPTSASKSPRAETPPPSSAGIGVFARFGAVWKDRRFLALLSLFSASQMAFTVITAAAPFMAENLLAGSKVDVAKLMGPFLGTALPCFALTPWLAKRYGWQRAMQFSSILLALAYLGFTSVGTPIIGSPMLTAMLLFGAAGPFAAVILGLENASVIDCAKRAGAMENTSLYIGVFNLVVKTLNGLASLLTGILASYSARPGQARLATRGMAVLAATLLAIGIAGFYLLRPQPPRSRRTLPRSG